MPRLPFPGPRGSAGRRELRDEERGVNRPDTTCQVVAGQRPEACDGVELALLREGDRVIAAGDVHESGRPGGGQLVQRRVDHAKVVPRVLVRNRDDAGEERGRLARAADDVETWGPATLEALIHDGAAVAGAAHADVGHAALVAHDRPDAILKAG